MTADGLAARSLCEAFQRTAAARPHEVALRTAGGATEITWAEYAHRARRIATGLAALGVTRGDTVALMMVNRPEFKQRRQPDRDLRAAVRPPRPGRLRPGRVRRHSRRVHGRPRRGRHSPGATRTSRSSPPPPARLRLRRRQGMAFGLNVTCVADTRAVAAALPEVRPTVWGAVPRIWEKLHAALTASIDSEPDEQRAAALRWAIDTGLRTVRAEQAAIDGLAPGPDAELRAEYQRADELVLAALREQLGLDQVRTAVSGGRPHARGPARVLRRPRDPDL